MKNICHNIDCMEFMKNVPDKYYELAITDPPYGIFDKNKVSGYLDTRKIDHKANEWDKKPSPEYFNELFRISKNQIIWGMQYFAEHLPSFSRLIIWDKMTGNNYFADGEAAFCSFPGGTLRIWKHQWLGTFKDSEKGEKPIQSCQKPIALYVWLLRNFAKPRDKIFDSHLGSGSIRIACHGLGFELEGCELNKENWEGQEERFNKYLDIEQGQLFSIEEYQDLIFGKE